MIIAGIFLCKLCAVLASSGSGAPGGVFTPTLFIGLAIGMLYGRSLGLWFPDGEIIIPEPCYVANKACIILAGGKPVPVETKLENGFVPTVTDLGKSSD